MEYRPEVLAPCGEYNSVIYAINAGAKAVYLGGSMFSARAYATNLSNEEIINAIHYAHLHDAKVYLTLNTLIKNNEFAEAIELIRPLYENGLDAVIIQDLGLLSTIHEAFPSLDIHASTQMSVMSRSGVRFLKEHGVTRVVPARELSASEIGELKEEGLEIECFVHGAMCYSYSGKCLFSSIAGGRSGNRGRCAGPCRKSYDVLDLNGNVIKKNCYPISMKDMCTIRDIDALIDNKVDSFKIEGRMKAPEYSAGVSNIYKKYSDRYIDNKVFNKNDISKADNEILKNLYVRSNLQSGYLNKQNGADMISMTNPAYNQVSKEVLEDIKNKYKDIKRVPISFEVSVFAGESLYGAVTYEDIRLDIYKENCLNAVNAPISEEAVIKQMGKLGSTNYSLKECIVYTDNNSYVSVSLLNELRRDLVALLDKELFSIRESYNIHDISLGADNNGDNKRLIIGLGNIKHLNVVRKYAVSKEYIIDAFSEIFDNDITFSENENVYIRIPNIVRQNTLQLIRSRIENIIKMNNIKGIYVNSLDGLSIAMDYFERENIYGDSGLYVFNDYAAEFIDRYVNEYTVSFEHNEKELKSYRNKFNRQIVIYGYIPVMYSANCLLKTASNCNKRCNGAVLRDENGRKFVSLCNHTLCYNTIYNNVPLNLFGEYDRLNDFSAVRIEFVNETDNEVETVLNEYENIKNYVKKGNNNYTLGHYKRGVE